MSEELFSANVTKDGSNTGMGRKMEDRGESSKNQEECLGQKVLGNSAKKEYSKAEPQGKHLK